jgi:hypothetical protein
MSKAMGIATTTKSEQIAIRFPHAVLAAVRAEATRRGMSVCGTVTALTAAALGVSGDGGASRSERPRKPPASGR